MRKVTRLLASVYFALFLIASLLIFVILGTLAEAHSHSHQYAEKIAYKNPWFRILMIGMFVNIFLSTIKRYPFKKRHIPFITTHLGLLMIILGTLLKSYFGLQGIMFLSEGTQSNRVFLVGTQGLQIEKKEANHIFTESVLVSKNTSFTPKSFPNLLISIIDRTSHGKQVFEAWIKKDLAYIDGLPPLAVKELQKNQKATPSLIKDDFHFYALKTNDIAQALKEIYEQQTHVLIKDHFNDNLIKKIPLDSEPTHRFHTYFEDNDLKSAHLNFQFGSSSIHQLNVPIFGEYAGLNVFYKKNLGTYPIAIDLETVPTILLIKDEKSQEHFFSFSPNGEIYGYFFSLNNCIVAYDKGFLGYSLECSFPFTKENYRSNHEKIIREAAVDFLKKTCTQDKLLVPPLKNLQIACDLANEDFIEVWIELLLQWDQNLCWLFPKTIPLSPRLSKVMDKLNLSMQDFKACFWISTLFENIEKEMINSKNPYTYLQKSGWPLPLENLVSDRDDYSLFQSLTNQLYASSQWLPPSSIPSYLNPSEKMHYFSAFLRAYEINWQSILHSQSYRYVKPQIIEKIGCPLTFHIIKENSPKKLEEAHPIISLEFEEENISEKIELCFDPTASQIKWPILNGKYLVRFQPHFFQIPYFVQLKKAKQISHLGQSQAFSYESELVLLDQKNREKEISLSMNHVYETKEGYRFYLSSISIPNEFGSKLIQLVVNKDPFKYWVTYPGAILLACGIVLLFWFQNLKR